MSAMEGDGDVDKDGDTENEGRDGNRWWLWWIRWGVDGDLINMVMWMMKIVKMKVMVMILRDADSPRYSPPPPEDKD